MSYVHFWFGRPELHLPRLLSRIVRNKFDMAKVIQFLRHEPVFSNIKIQHYLSLFTNLVHDALRTFVNNLSLKTAIFYFSDCGIVCDSHGHIATGKMHAFRVFIFMFVSVMSYTHVALRPLDCLANLLLTSFVLFPLLLNEDAKYLQFVHFKFPHCWFRF